MATQAISGERAAPKAHRKLPSEINILLVLIGIAAAALLAPSFRRFRLAD